MVDERPFEDVETTDDGFSIPELKWRELLFLGALIMESFFGIPGLGSYTIDARVRNISDGGTPSYIGLDDITLTP